MKDLNHVSTATDAAAVATTTPTNGAFNYKPVINKKRGRRKQPQTVSLKESIESRIESLVASKFYSELLDLLATKVCKLPFHDIVCYGIGTLSSRISQFQFALLLKLREILEITGKVYIYDPIFTTEDHDVLAHYDMLLIPTNERAKRPISLPTLFYMPHCSQTLYSNLLGSNWSQEKLEKLVLIGNRIEKYAENNTEATLNRKAPYLLPSLTLLQCVEFPSSFEDNCVFNDTCWQSFDPEKIMTVDDGFWDEREVTENDTELI
ncbi:uncharacterized protein VTP21DRAFT_7433 [Calcarisporiella thermophila]|uniref:uncharacterized protein n=1 Tax=Calcarisporiella thermophila TaxID=911321 RepID=UPI00374319AE